MKVYVVQNVSEHQLHGVYTSIETAQIAIVAYFVNRKQSVQLWELDQLSISEFVVNAGWNEGQHYLDIPVEWNYIYCFNKILEKRKQLQTLTQ